MFSSASAFTRYIVTTRPTIAESLCITLIDLPAITPAELERWRALTAPLVGDEHDYRYTSRRDYARSFPLLPNHAIACTRCAASGVIVVGQWDDLQEYRCSDCLGTGVVDLADAQTEELQAIT